MLKEQICEAIRNKRVISFSYKMQVRVVEPHLLGFDGDGDLTLSAWQTSGLKPGWRDFHVAKLSGLSATGQTFAKSRPGYNPRDETLERIVCRL